jgi:hypothetical protein
MGFERVLLIERIGFWGAVRSRTLFKACSIGLCSLRRLFFGLKMRFLGQICEGSANSLPAQGFDCYSLQYNSNATTWSAAGKCLQSLWFPPQVSHLSLLALRRGPTAASACLELAGPYLVQRVVWSQTPSQPGELRLSSLPFPTQWHKPQ